MADEIDEIDELVHEENNWEEAPEEPQEDLQPESNIEEEEPEEEEVDIHSEEEEVEYSEEDILAKVENGDSLTDEEQQFLEENGYEIQEEGSEEEEDEDEEEEEEEEEIDNEVPEDMEVFETEKIDGILSEIAPNQEFNSFEEKEQAIAEHFEKEKQTNEVLTSIFENNSELVDLVNYLNENPNSGFKEAIIGTGIDIESAIPEPTDPEYRDYILSQEKAKENKKNIEKVNKERAENYNKSENQFIDFIKEKKLSKKDAQHISSQVDEVVENLAMGIYSRKFLEGILKANNYESDVAKAKVTGEVNERNKKIVVMKNKSKKRIPSLNSKGQKTKQKFSKDDTQLLDDLTPSVSQDWESIT